MSVISSNLNLGTVVSPTNSIDIGLKWIVTLKDKNILLIIAYIHFDGTFPYIDIYRTLFVTELKLRIIDVHWRYKAFHLNDHQQEFFFALSKSITNL